MAGVVSKGPGIGHMCCVEVGELRGVEGDNGCRYTLQDLLNQKMSKLYLYKVSSLD